MTQTIQPHDDTLAKSMMRRFGLRVRPEREWNAERARRERQASRQTLIAAADVTVEQYGLRARRGQAAIAALMAALDAVQARAQQRTLTIGDLSQAVNETLDSQDDGSGYIVAGHRVAGSYGYPVSYTYIRAQWCVPGVLVIVGRNASTQRDRLVLIAHATARVLRARLVRVSVVTALAKLSVDQRGVLVTREDSLRAGNCERITDQAVVALGAPARADAVVRWTAEHGIATDYALRAVRVAAERQAMERA